METRCGIRCRRIRVRLSLVFVDWQTNDTEVEPFSDASAVLSVKFVKDLVSQGARAFCPPLTRHFSVNKFEGVLGGDKKIQRLAEVFGHEGGHGVYALDNIAESVQLQRLLNSNEAARNALPVKGRYPLPPDLLQKIADADRRLIPTERYAQQVEKIINGELRASSQKKK